tara:strand:- start:288 stop:680 length:393 start_codon:yes stop_codon:yes gene_type:complete
MKHLLILLSISFLAGCASNGATNFSVATQFQPNRSVAAIGFNIAKKHYYEVPRSAQQEYTRCTSFALRSMQVGEQCTWEDPGTAIGIVKLVKIDATGCHYMFNTMMYKNKQKNWQETACYSYGSKQWKFK